MNGDWACVENAAWGAIEEIRSSLNGLPWNSEKKLDAAVDAAIQNLRVIRDEAARLKRQRRNQAEGGDN